MKRTEFVVNLLALFLVVHVFFRRYFFHSFSIFLPYLVHTRAHNQFVSIHFVIIYFLLNSHANVHCASFSKTSVFGCEQWTLNMYAYKIAYICASLPWESFDLNHFLLCGVVAVATGKQSLNYFCQVLCSLPYSLCVCSLFAFQKVRFQTHSETLPEWKHTHTCIQRMILYNILVLKQ